VNAKPRRLFFGIWPDAASRQRLAAWQRSVIWPARARCTAEQDLHLTLHFMGDVPDEALAELSARDRLPAPPRLAFDLDQAVVWHRGLVVLQPRVVPAALLGLHEALQAVLLKLGIAVEARPYVPHVTMARNAGGSWPSSVAIDPIRWVSRGYSLASRSGAHYRAVASFETP
jgi:RNA 2',3'-cyclic 3'-phosphodiesterase